jgi:hypothetical protein
MTKLQHIWRTNKCLFIFGILIISFVVVLIILGVVTLVVAPALPQLRTPPMNTSFSLRTFEDSFKTASVNISELLYQTT